MAEDARAKPIVRTKDEARAGETGDHVRYILVFGTVILVIAFAVLYLVFFS